MRRTVWTLVVALLLQLVASSAWALRGPHSPGPTGHCHASVAAGPAVQAPETAHTLPAPDAASTPSLQIDSHHCCAVGLGLGLPVLPPPLPQASPHSPLRHWLSWSLRPDLRPPI